ncbi:hypothetical protein [Flavobacterium silvaticum]|uniref:Aspartyl protease n=1 Tax=Flavobacterium silvaticum TaxID=1852020 RepID=A0A972JGA9_9FLAO|nr:hypothetical protein [Flavobacterium silvaticum]NMH28859.1 hypothetical protein [Flavobacterium silvaticum]
MKLLKKMVLAFLVLITLTFLFGYVYFDRKFSPDKNYLHVTNESGKVFVRWETEEKKVMLLPIHFNTDTTTYYMQFDTGSPYTMFYKTPVSTISQISKSKMTAKCRFRIGNCEVKSDCFKMIDFGEKTNEGQLPVIGTIGTDILENRKTLLNLRENYVVFNLGSVPDHIKTKTFRFQFKKRKIIIPAMLQNQKEAFLYDSGTSGYELLTNKEIWERLKSKDSKIKQEKGKSWKNILTTYTAETNENIAFPNTAIPLHEITYVEGYSKAQYYLMKFSGMSGMLGNKLFLQKELYIDAENRQMAIE